MPCPSIAENCFARPITACIDWLGGSTTMVGIRPFFNDHEIRRAVAPIAAEHRRASIQVALPPKPADRPTLYVRGKDRSS